MWRRRCHGFFFLFFFFNLIYVLLKGIKLEIKGKAKMGDLGCWKGDGWDGFFKIIYI